MMSLLKYLFTINLITIYNKPVDQYIVLDIKEINVDAYLDQMNNDSLLETDDKNLRQIL